MAYSDQISVMQETIDEMSDHFNPKDLEMVSVLNNTITMQKNLKRALMQNERALRKPYFGRIVIYDEKVGEAENLYIGKGGIAIDATHWVVIDWRAPIANVYYENGLGQTQYRTPDGTIREIALNGKRTYEIEDGKLIDYFESEVVANDELLTKYLAKNKQAVLGEIVATIQKEQNDIIRRTPFHNLIVQGVAGSGKTTVAMHRISYILYNYADKFRPEDFYIIGSNRFLLQYITSVLPDLDVHGVKQMTMEELFIRLLYEAWDDKNCKVSATDTETVADKIKGTKQWFGFLQDFLTDYEWNQVKREDILLYRDQFVEGLEGGTGGVYDRRSENTDGGFTVLMRCEDIEQYLRENPNLSLATKIGILNERLHGKVEVELLGKDVKYSDAEKRAIRKAFRNYFGKEKWKTSVFDIYASFIEEQRLKGLKVSVDQKALNVYDLAAMAYIYRRIIETERIAEARHMVIDEAQDFGMMVYLSLNACVSGCTYTIMGDVSQNIHYGYGLNDWEELRTEYLKSDRAWFGILKKSYRNTIEIADYAMQILQHGKFRVYPAEPVLRHGAPVLEKLCENEKKAVITAAEICDDWIKRGLETIAVICKDQAEASHVSMLLSEKISLLHIDKEEASFGKGIMVLSCAMTKGLEFDAVLLWNPTMKNYPADDAHAKLLYVAATRALHELAVCHWEPLTELITEKCERNLVIKEERRPLIKTDSVNVKQTNKPSKKIGKKIIIAGNPEQKNSVTLQASIETEEIKRKNPDQKKPQISDQDKWNNLPQKEQRKSGIQFGDMPTTEKLLIPGHSKIDLSVKWIQKRPDGIYIQSRYGVLRIRLIGSAIARISFCKDVTFAMPPHPLIQVDRMDAQVKCRENPQLVEITTPELALVIEKKTGRLSFYSADKKTLYLAESKEDMRQADIKMGGKYQVIQKFSWDGKENLTAYSSEHRTGVPLNKTARYLIGENAANRLPLILSEKGYGLVMAMNGPILACDIPAYGSFCKAEKTWGIDYYFIAGKKAETILRAYEYLCR